MDKKIIYIVLLVLAIFLLFLITGNNTEEEKYRNLENFVSEEIITSSENDNVDDSTIQQILRKQIYDEFQSYVNDTINKFEKTTLQKLSDNGLEDRTLTLKKLKEDLTRQIMSDFNNNIDDHLNNLQLGGPGNKKINRLTFGDEESHISLDPSGKILKINGKRLDINAKNICLNNVCLDVKKIPKLIKSIIRDTGSSNINDMVEFINKGYKSGQEIQKIIKRRNGSTYSSDVNDYKIYDDIFDAYNNEGNIAQYKNPAVFNITQYADTQFGGKYMIQFGGNSESLSTGGAIIDVPQNYDVLWLRVPSARLTALQVNYEKNLELIGIYTSAYSFYNTLCPDGGPENAYSYDYVWMPIPVPNAGKIILTSINPTNNGFWLSGFAFSTNPYNHATTTSLAYANGLNGGNKITWSGNNNYNMGIGVIPSGTKDNNLMVPIILSGNDKLLYFVFCDSTDGNSDPCSCTSVSINGIPIERFKTTYVNPFSLHHKRRMTRYYAATIPSELLAKLPASTKFIKVTIDMSQQNNGINISEMGTHDFI